jgi:hypothetical protein
MKPMLHDSNEESDLQVYRAYVRSLSYDDLRDIRAHLDEELYPARFDALRREIEWRQMTSALSVHTKSPNRI